MKIVGWWSGGITSAVTCKICIDLYGIENVLLLFIDTKNEDDDTYRFKKDCEKWYGNTINSITAIRNKEGITSIQDVWMKYNSLNVARGAICSTVLKREVREEWQKSNDYIHQAFGFELDKKEVNRAIAMTMNHPDSKPIYPLLMYGYSKQDCIKKLEDAKIDVPITYKLGFSNNNCFKTGCIQGGIGYWQKMKRDQLDKFDKMADMEHLLTDRKGKPVTMLKDQSKEAKDSGNFLVFLKPHPKYPELKDLSMMKGREPEPLFECNGFCGTNDLVERKESEQDINYGEQIKLEL